MKPMLFILTLSAVFCFTSVAQEPVETPIAEYSGRVVVFFAPNQVEFDSLASVGDSGIDEVLADFQFYAGKVREFLKAHRIEVAMTSASEIHIAWSKRTFRFARHNAKSPVGMVLSDGVHFPRVEFGVDTDDGLQRTFRDYFSLKE